MRRFSALALAIGIGLPLAARAQAPSNEELLKEIQSLKERIQQLEEKAKALDDAGGPIDRDEFNRIKTKAEALEDQKEAAGFKGFRVAGGIDPAYMYNKALGSRSFSFLNAFSGTNVYTYDNSYTGTAYIDFQKEMQDGGTRFRLTLVPRKSAGSAFDPGSIVHEASASIPLSDAQTRLMVGQLPDFSGYDNYFSSFSGTNAITSNQLYPGYPTAFITHNLLFDFAELTAYTGVGLDITRGYWETKAVLANANSPRYDSSNCGGCRPQTSPTLILNTTYAKEEFWYVEGTAYLGKVTNFNNVTDGSSTRADAMKQLEVDGNFTRGDFMGNVQFTYGTQKNAAFNGGDAKWWGTSIMASERLDPVFSVAGRVDYMNNSKNGGGGFAIASQAPSQAGLSGNNFAPGDFYDGFGPGDPTAPGYDVNSGANRYSLTLSSTYRYTQNVSFRAEYRYDHASKAAFYYVPTGDFRNSNDLLGVQTIVNF